MYRKLFKIIYKKKYIIYSEEFYDATTSDEMGKKKVKWNYEYLFLYTSHSSQVDFVPPVESCPRWSVYRQLTSVLQRRLIMKSEGIFIITIRLNNSIPFILLRFLFLHEYLLYSFSFPTLIFLTYSRQSDFPFSCLFCLFLNLSFFPLR